jgi:hypothetical protein
MTLSLVTAGLPFRRACAGGWYPIRFKQASVALLRTGIVLLVSAVWAHTASAEGTVSLSGLGATPTGLAAGAFLDSEPVRTTAPVETSLAVLPIARSQKSGPPAAWRSASPLERSMISDGDTDLFPHTRRTVPLLAPDALNGSTQSVPPLRAMNGPSVGVRWKIPGYTP